MSFRFLGFIVSFFLSTPWARARIKLRNQEADLARSREELAKIQAKVALYESTICGLHADLLEARKDAAASHRAATTMTAQRDHLRDQLAEFSSFGLFGKTERPSA